MIAPALRLDLRGELQVAAQELASPVSEENTRDVALSVLQVAIALSEHAMAQPRCMDLVEREASHLAARRAARQTSADLVLDVADGLQNRGHVTPEVRELAERLVELLLEDLKFGVVGAHGCASCSSVGGTSEGTAAVGSQGPAAPFTATPWLCPVCAAAKFEAAR